MTDDLDSKTDAELNELFAVEVAGWTRMDHMLYDVGDYRGIGARERSDGKWITNEVPFATSADAVLPYVEVDPTMEVSRTKLGPPMWRVSSINRGGCIHKSFARAACIALICCARNDALIRAKRAPQ
jgi:hypothetical protein